MKTWQKIRNDPRLREKYLVREKVIDGMRNWFKEQGFAEVQTPVLVPVPSAEPNLEPFETQLVTGRRIKRAGYLIMSPEFSLKKLLAAGMGNVFEITRAFRNGEEVSAWHSPEFTILEWYRKEADYRKIMGDFENLFVKIIGAEKMKYQGEEYDLSRPWPRYSCEELGLMGLPEPEFNLKFYNEIEPRLRESRKPAFVYDYPAEQASLSRKKKDDPRFAERFEVFLAGVELGNAFSELTDAAEQEARFKNELQGRDFGMDEDFIEALKAGLPECAGMAVGMDRVIMLAADVPTIADTLFFPAGEMFGLDNDLNAR